MEMYVLMAYYGEWDVNIKLLGVFSTHEKAEEAKKEYEMVVMDYLKKCPYPDYFNDSKSEDMTEEEEEIYDSWRYGMNCHLVDFTACHIFMFEVDKMKK
jgi:hypothetical protein